MVRRLKVKRLGRKFSRRPIGRDNYLLASMIKPIRGGWGGSRDVGNCSTVVIQAKRRAGVKPTSVVWHIFPPHINIFCGTGEIINRDYQEEYEKLRRNLRSWGNHHNVRSGLQRSLMRRLQRGRTMEFNETNSMHPEVIVENILRFLEGERRGKAIIRVTAIPGYHALDRGDYSYREAKFALDTVLGILRGHKKVGRVKSVRTRGMSKKAKSVGAYHVLISPSGRIFRQDVRKIEGKDG